MKFSSVSPVIRNYLGDANQVRCHVNRRDYLNAIAFNWLPSMFNALLFRQFYPAIIIDRLLMIHLRPELPILSTTARLSLGSRDWVVDVLLKCLEENHLNYGQFN